MEDTKSVPTGEVPEGTPSTEEVSQPPQPQPLSEDRIQQMIAEAVKAAKEEGKREMQGKKDKEVAKAQREVRTYQEALEAFKGQLADVDPETAAKFRIAELEARDKQRIAHEQVEVQRQQYEETIQSFRDNLSQYIQSEGVDPSDKRMDWGNDSEPLLTRQQRILASMAKIRKEDASKTEEKAKGKIKDLINQERKEAGLEVVDTSGGVGTTTITPERLKSLLSNTDKFGELVKRDEKGISQAEKLAEQVWRDFKAGKFK